MGGKTSQTSQSVSIPPQVLARYNAVNNRAEAVATQPFQQYSQNPNAFVAPINNQQNLGIGGINNAANLAQPYYGTAGQMTMAGAGAVAPQQYSSGAVQQYMNPYISNVADTTAAQMKNVFGQQAEELKGGAIRAGAFGGDRAGIAQGNLANQQGLAFGQNMANIYGTGFNQAQQQFNQQQGVNLQAEQANQARLLAAGQQLGGLGGAAQASALQGAQAQLGAGTLQQQTQQAGLTALYNQFQQQQAYPFQVAQFLANIAMGTGALSGSNTTTTQPAPFFSDERMKDNVETIGKTFDGQNIVKFNYKGDKQKQIGLIAQDVERHHPEAVGLAGGMKTVDYDGATKHAARMGKFAGGLATQSEGGAVAPMHAGEGFAVGGMPAGIDTKGLQGTIAMQQAPQDSAGLIANAQSYAPQFEVPQSVTKPVFNPQPIAGTGTTTGTGKDAIPSGPDFTNWSDYMAGLAAGRDMNDPSLRPPVAPQAPKAPEDTNNNHNHRRLNNYVRNDRSDNPSSYGNAGGGLSEQGQRDLSEYGGIFARGGNVGYAEGGGIDLDTILARQAQMYSGFKSPGQAREGGFGGLPHGAKSHVPEANLPVSQLKTAGPIPEQQASALEQGMTAIEKAQKIASMLDTSDPTSLSGLAKRASGSKLNDDGKTFDNDDDPTTEKARGGFLAYASGGTLPYGEENYEDKKLDIPNDKSTLKLPTAPTPQQQDSGLGTLSTALSLGKTILGFLPFEQGGRVGYADGGDPEDVVKRYGPAIGRVESGGEKDPYAALGPVTRKGDRAYGKYQVMGANIPSWTEEAIGRRMTPEEFLASQEAQDRVFGHHFGKALKQYGNPDDAASVWFSGRPVSKAGNVTDATPTTKGIGVPEYVSRFRAGLGEGESPKSAGLAPSDERANLPAKKAVNVNDQAPEKKSSGLGMNQETIVPLLTGLGAMLSSRSPYLASAIGEGIVAGGQSYMGTQKQAADIAQTQSETAARQAQTERENLFERQGKLFYLVRNPDGTFTRVRYREGMSIPSSVVDPKVVPSIPEERIQEAPENGAPAGGLGAGTTETKPSEGTGLVPAAGAAVAAVAPLVKLDDQSRQAMLTEAQQVDALGRENAEKAKKDMINPEIARGNDASLLRKDLSTYAGALSMRTRSGFTEPGPLARPIHEAGKALSEIASGLGQKWLEPDPSRIGYEEEILKGYKTLSARAAAMGDQKALGALAEFGEMFPGLETSHEGSKVNIANILTRNQMDIERGQMAQKWMDEATKTGITNPSLTGSSLNTQFMRQYGDQYNRDKETIMKMYDDKITNPKTGKQETVLHFLANSGQDMDDQTKRIILKKYGNPYVFRYFPNIGGQ